VTERSFEADDFWKEIYPDKDRRGKVKAFVKGVSEDIERLEKVLLIRFENGAERLYLFFNPLIPVDSVERDGGLHGVARLTGPRTLSQIKGLYISGKDGNSISDHANDNFSDSGWEFKDWPWPFGFTEDLYKSTLANNKSIRDAKKFILWERQEEAAQV